MPIQPPSFGSFNPPTFGIDVNQVKGSIPSDLKLKDISKLRPIILNKGLKIVNKQLPNLVREVVKFEDLCPPASTLQKIIDKRNNIIDEANQIADLINNLVNALTVASTALGVIVTLINVVKIVKQIVQVVAGFIPLSPGAIPAGIGALGDGLNAAINKKDGAPRFPPLKAKIDGLLIPLGIVLTAITALISVLSNLDGAIAACVTPIGGGGGNNGEGGTPGEVLRGPVLKLKIENPGSQYKNGTYEDVKLKGGDGKGCRATIKVKKKEVVKVTVTDGGDGYSTQLFDPSKGFKSPNFLYVKKGKFGKTKLDVKELLETIDLKKRILKKVKKKKVKGDGMLLSVQEIGVSQNTGGNNLGDFDVDLDAQGRIRNRNLNKGGINRVKVTGRGGGYPNGVYTDVQLGNGAVGNIIIQNNQLGDVIITEGGDGFELGDGIQINIPPGSGAEVQVDGVDSPFISDLGTGQDAGGSSGIDPSSGGTIDGSGLGDNSEDNIKIGSGVDVGLGTDGGTGQNSGGGFGTGANLAGEGIGGTLGIGSGDDIAQGVGQGNIPGLNGTGTGTDADGGTNGVGIGVGIGEGVTTGIVNSIDLGNGGNGYEDGIFNGQYLGGGSGTGLVANVTVENGTITGIDVTDGGSGYEEGDVFTVPITLGINGGDGITQDASISAGEIGATQVNPDTGILDTNTGIVSTTIVPAEQYVDENQKLLAVLSGVPLSVTDENGNEIILPGLTALDPGVVKLAALTQQASETENESTYKGFVIEIEERQFSEDLTQRRAVAFNPSGIVVAATEFSFATDESVLIDDVKLIIDEQNLRVTFEDLLQVTSIESEVALPGDSSFIS